MSELPIPRRERAGLVEGVPHLTTAERVARGKEVRARVPRSKHAVFAPPSSRPDPLALLAEQDTERVSELVPIRYGRMLASPFAFFRGAALVMASDLAETPSSGLLAQLCGDAHLSNFGLFASPERNVVFDVNDFDETLPGPWEWDVKRLSASLEIAGRDNGYTRTQREAVVLASVRQYREAMRTFADMPTLEVWYAHADMADVSAHQAAQLGAQREQKLSRSLAKARTRNSLRELNKLTTEVDGEPRIVADPPLLVPLTDLLPVQMDRHVLEERLQALLRGYRGSLASDRQVLLDQFRVTDLARKVVGVGSVGTRCWIALMLGRDARDPLFLQIKEAGRSVLERFVRPTDYANAGERVVAGQRVMQAVSDIFLGWERIEGIDGQTRDFYVRQLRDWKGSADITTMPPDGMRLYGRLCGWTLARAHARSGDRIAIAAYLGTGASFEQAIAQFAQAYADLNEHDYRALQEAVAAGRIVAETGV